jgi:hypothetical protein
MSCCGSQRAALRAAQGEFSQSVRTATPTSAPDEPIAVEYVHDGEIVVRGAASGRLHRFAAGAPLSIPAQDARVLVANGPFRVARDHRLGRA